MQQFTHKELETPTNLSSEWRWADFHLWVSSYPDTFGFTVQHQQDFLFGFQDWTKHTHLHVVIFHLEIVIIKYLIQSYWFFILYTFVKQF